MGLQKNNQLCNQYTQKRYNHAPGPTHLSSVIIVREINETNKVT
jgi:hypothetical protein